MPNHITIPNPMESTMTDSNTPANSSGWETTNEAVARVQDEAYEKGLRDGYRKAEQESKTAAYTREDAIVAATKAITAMQYMAAPPDLISLAQQIERYVNGDDRHEQESPVEYTAEDLDKLGQGVVVFDRDGDEWTRQSNRSWRMDGGSLDRSSRDIIHRYGPITPTYAGSNG